MSEEDRGLTSRIGPVEIDWPHTIGYYGGIGLAMAFELIEPPLALFIADVPFFKMLNVPQASRPMRFVAQILDGAAKPVGGSAEATLRLSTDTSQHLSFLQEARQLARHMSMKKGEETS
ncbi:hypothetical protein [Dictyobacter formicarum]|uniref:Thioesterase domain-containing protein n=1 Tax=Dictyobacter formicarum TaxID=2778368 RepID=A0ABQ3VH59_9CHLR|nr:hypothetical protein [Dictyobacter formicarum]GHO85039.1 hypothetical protein KSZ_30450 [Dictyobacter formicarum]